MRDVATIQSYSTAGRLYYYPDKSTVTPPPPVLTPAALAAEAAAAQAAEKAALLNLPRSPKLTGTQLTELAREKAVSIALGSEVLLHLLGDKTGQSPQFHALNTMTLCRLVGKKQRCPSEVWPTSLWAH